MYKYVVIIIYLFYHMNSDSMVQTFYHNSNESSASIHICILPSRYNFAYSSGSSIASAFNAHSEQGVVFNPSSAFPQSILRRYPAVVAMSMLL